MVAAWGGSQAAAVVAVVVAVAWAGRRAAGCRTSSSVRGTRAVPEAAFPAVAAFRAVAAALDQAPPHTREALARWAGIEAEGGRLVPGRRVLRRMMGLEESSRERRNPIARNEPFRCLSCGLDVEATRRGGPRSHCPRCLRSLHVDVVPGDRASACGGLMDPVSWATRGEDVTLLHRCRTCGFQRPARLLLEAEPQPDDLSVLLALRPASGEEVQ